MGTPVGTIKESKTIPLKFKTVTEKIVKLSEQIAAIKSKLVPVLEPESPPNQPTEGEAIANNSPMAEQLSSIEDLVWKELVETENILNRLQI